jgi:hypothetical protein
MRQVPLVQCHVLDPDDALVGLERRDAVDEQKRITMRKDPFDRRVVEGKRDVQIASIIRETTRRNPAASACRGVVRAWKDQLCDSPNPLLFGRAPDLPSAPDQQRTRAQAAGRRCSGA